MPGFICFPLISKKAKKEGRNKITRRCLPFSTGFTKRQTKAIRENKLNGSFTLTVDDSHDTSRVSVGDSSHPDSNDSEKEQLFVKLVETQAEENPGQSLPKTETSAIPASLSAKATSITTGSSVVVDVDVVVNVGSNLTAMDVVAQAVFTSKDLAAPIALPRRTTSKPVSSRRQSNNVMPKSPVRANSTPASIYGYDPRHRPNSDDEEDDDQEEEEVILFDFDEMRPQNSNNNNQTEDDGGVPKNESATDDDDENDGFSDVSSLTGIGGDRSVPVLMEYFLESAIPERILLGGGGGAGGCAGAGGGGINNHIDPVASTAISRKIRKLRERFRDMVPKRVGVSTGGGVCDLLSVGTGTLMDRHGVSKCLVLLMEPESKRFELIPVAYYPEASSSQDVLAQIRLQGCSNYRLRFQRYVGLLDLATSSSTSSMELPPHRPLAKAYGCEVQDQENPLVAVPDGYSAVTIASLARMLLNQHDVRQSLYDLQDVVMSGLGYD